MVACPIADGSMVAREAACTTSTSRLRAQARSAEHEVGVEASREARWVGAHPIVPKQEQDDMAKKYGEKLAAEAEGEVGLSPR